MFREMRRKQQVLPQSEVVSVLEKNSSGVLGVIGDDAYPYTVPLSYVYKDNKLYFHCAKQGHKLDSIQKNAKVSFCVIDQDEVIPEKLTTLYRSVIIFGKAKILTDDAERRNALEYLAAKYSPTYQEEGEKDIQREWSRVCLVEVAIEHMTGKEALGIVKSKRQ
jgi:uncharacterized protein